MVKIGPTPAPQERAANDALDADRYRWLRDKGRQNGVRVEEIRSNTIYTHAASTLDKAIDGFLQLEKKS